LIDRVKNSIQLFHSLPSDEQSLKEREKERERGREKIAFTLFFSLSFSPNLCKKSRTNLALVLRQNPSVRKVLRLRGAPFQKDAVLVLA